MINKIDWTPFLLMLVLIIIGTIMIFSTSSVVGLASYNNGYFFIKRHLVFLFLGFLAFLVGMFFNANLYKRFVLPGLIISNILLLFTLIPGIGVKVGGASRWLNLGIQFQPVELSKFCLAIFLAAYLENKKFLLPNFFKGILPALIVIGISIMFLILQPDLGNSLLILGITFILLFISNTRLSHLIFLIISGLGFVVINILAHPYQLARIKTFLSPWADPTGKSYHIVQSFIAIGSGGLLGQGIGQSKLKYFYLPLHYSDFIFSVLCEEGGFLLGFFVILLFIILFIKGVSISLKAQNSFLMYLGLAITMFLVIQALINIGVVIGVFPVTGIPLTFISFGGTALVSSMFYIGVLTNISIKE
ncbi:FtsW/RodA/SpoVE family cell cycle protein [Candidatus Margulisiibacteriota bacterium]